MSKTKLSLSTIEVIDNTTPPYTGDGCNQVDKTAKNTYSNSSQSVTVERCFIGKQSVSLLVKQLINEHCKANVDIANVAAAIYNKPCNTTVASTTKEGTH